ncbi:MAG: glycosyltransferase family 2 protein [Lachnospiraceae bacterium]|nr:glycosyltransferase family 2 protein [Lachnospiraceae bacterium]
MSNKIAAVVVTYNRKELLLECLEKLFKQTFDAFDILLIDNHSTDGTREAVEKYLVDPRMIYKDTGSNLGGAGGFQFGIKEAADRKYDYIWTMDDDCMPEPDALQKLIDANNELHDPGYLSSVVLWTDGKLCQTNIHRSSLTKKIAVLTEKYTEAVLGSFVSLWVPMSVVKEVGLPIKEFFIWGDDWEFTRRISRQYKCYVVSDSKVVHKTKSNTGVNIATDSEDRIERYRYAYRNEMYLFKREGIKGISYIFARTLIHVFRVLLFAKSKKMYRIKLIIGSTIQGIRFNPKIEKI